ncbi:MAG: helix-turn-helix domain-containing protein [Muribaculaceae bacterium]
MPERRGRTKPPPRAEGSKGLTDKTKKGDRSLLEINYLCFVMKYKQLTSQQRSQIFALLQRKTPRKEIALIVGCSQATLNRQVQI